MIHPHFIVTDCLDHQVHFSHRGITGSTLITGKVEQTNFKSYQVLRIDEMPKVDVHIVQSLEAPTGVGEPGVAPIGPAIANAVLAATGKRLRILPFSVGGTA